ncbi:MAG: hypothetical protein OXQ29_23335 [Rhodospirillaceae bacterium]|nr:hypothetical protein [Rhodospirillaceae bacterium]
MQKSNPCITIMRRALATALLLVLSSHFSLARAESVSASSVLYAAALFTQMLAHVTRSQTHGADPDALVVLHNRALIIQLKTHTDRLGNQLSLIHNQISLLPKQVRETTELQFDLNAQNHFYAAIKGVTDEMLALEEGLQRDIPLLDLLHVLVVTRDRLMQRSFLNAAAIIYGWTFEIAFRTTLKQSHAKLLHVDGIYREWLTRANDSANSDSLPSLHQRWRANRLEYQYRLFDKIEPLISAMGALEPYYLDKSPRPQDCNVWLFCNSSTKGRKYNRWPSRFESFGSYWQYPYHLTHATDAYEYPGSCNRDKDGVNYMTIAKCDWTINYGNYIRSSQENA